MFDGAMKHRFALVIFFVLDRHSREGTFRTLEYLQKLSAVNCRVVVSMGSNRKLQIHRAENCY
jgi:hypothetical protein